MDIGDLKRYADNIPKGKEDELPEVLTAKVSGVTFDGRQEFLGKMDKETPVYLERDRRNEFDPYAIKVIATIEGKEEHVGFVPKYMAKKLSKRIDLGEAYSTYVKDVTGGHEGLEFLGLLIVIEKKAGSNE